MDITRIRTEYHIKHDLINDEFIIPKKYKEELYEYIYDIIRFYTDYSETFEVDINLLKEKINKIKKEKTKIIFGEYTNKKLNKIFQYWINSNIKNKEKLDNNNIIIIDWI